VPDLSGDGRAGATAPTTTAGNAAARGFAYQREFVVSQIAAYYRCGDDVSERACLEAAEEDVATLLRVHLAAWIDGLTPEQLSDLDVACERAMTTEDLRAALTRLGGAHE
jgi:hypothetical protein